MQNYRSLNLVTLQGRLGANADVKQTKGGQSFLSFSVATQSSSKDANGNWVHPSTWHSCKFFGPRAEKIAPMLVKGATVTLIGSLANFESTAADGRKTRFTYVNVEDVTGIAEPSKGAANAAPNPYGKEQSRSAAPAASGAANSATDPRETAAYF